MYILNRMYCGYSDDSNVSGKSLRSILISIHELLIIKLSSEVHFRVYVANNCDKVHSIYPSLRTTISDLLACQTRTVHTGKDKPNETAHSN